jgi:hypothetical protein
VVDECIDSQRVTAMRRRRVGPGFVVGIVLLLGIPVAGQSGFFQFPPSNNGRLGKGYPDATGQFPPDPNSPDQKRLRMLNTERQKQIVSETEKLLKLAQELNAEVAESASTSMSDEELHKVGEIAKLAKSVKEKMSFSAGGYPGLNTPLTTTPGIQ